MSLTTPIDLRRVLAEDHDALANGDPPREGASDERLVDHDHRRRVPRVARLELASREHACAERAENVVAHVQGGSGGPDRTRGNDLAGQRVPVSLAGAAKRRILDGSRGDHASDAPHGVEHLPVSEAIVRVAFRVEREVEHHGLRGREPRVNGEQPRKRADHQAATDHEHHRERHFGDHQSVAKAQSSADHAAPARAQLVMHRARDGVHRRHQAEHHASEHRDRQREKQHRAINATSESRGSWPAESETSAFTPPRESTMPVTPPSSASTRLSVSSCRTMRPRPAPSAVRTAISRLRTVARASSSEATLTQAMSRTNATAPEQHEQSALDVARQ